MKNEYVVYISHINNMNKKIDRYKLMKKMMLTQNPVSQSYRSCGLCQYLYKLHECMEACIKLYPWVCDVLLLLLKIFEMDFRLQMLGFLLKTCDSALVHI
jgi:hypothetical protein